MRDKLAKLIFDCWLVGTSDADGRAPTAAEYADHLIAHGVTFADVPDNNVGDKKPLTIGERADIARICMGIEQLCRNMAQPGTWEAHTRHMECGEIRELVQRYRDMELVYKALTGHELFVSLKEVET